MTSAEMILPIVTALAGGFLTAGVAYLRNRNLQPLELADRILSFNKDLEARLDVLEAELQNLERENLSLKAENKKLRSRVKILEDEKT